MKAFIGSYDQKGVTKQVKFDAKGEPAEVTVWAYKVEGGKIVKDQEIK
jgi:branched-chain amino acid transport system substrate-binding protein